MRLEPSSTINFGAADPWNSYLSTLEGLTPKIEAIAITDYYVTDTYEEFLKYKAGGRLPGVSLLFPNIELRLDIAAKTGFVNVHLLVIHIPSVNDQSFCRLCGRIFHLCYCVQLHLQHQCGIRKLTDLLVLTFWDFRKFINACFRRRGNVARKISSDA